ncbi:MAG TPA: zinc ABC transporter permease AztB [Acidimicrobiia bacterium]|nr:zinc ABC transporter permease AztB [Acidimicrobiia bacterium]
MDWLSQPFEPEFMRQALVAGLLAAVTTSLVGTWVVLRGMSFIGDALAHGVLPGIALAFVAGFDVTLGGMLGAAVMVGGINVVTRRSRLAEDTGIGLLFVGMLALGVVIVSREGSFATDLTGFLFGNILAVDDGDLWILTGAALVALLGVAAFYRSFLVLSFNVDKAEMLGLAPRFAHTVLLVLVAVAVVSSFRAVGTLLVFALLVAPPATASLIVRRVPVMMATSAAVGAASVVVGLLVSYHEGTAAGASIALVAVVIFFVVLTVREIGVRFAERRVALPTGYGSGASPPTA